MTLKCAYPNQMNCPSDVALMMVGVWAELYKDFTFDEVMTAFFKVTRESKSPYIPAHGEIIEQIQEARKPRRGLNPELLAERQAQIAKKEAEKMERVKEWQRKLTNE